MTQKPQKSTNKTYNKSKENQISSNVNKAMRKNVLDFSYGSLHSILLYKIRNFKPKNAKHKAMSGFVTFIDPKNTTKMCSCCGAIKNMSIKDRTYNCNSCGLKLDRDLNSAINIRHKVPHFLLEE